jgi:hypothetical protein
MWFRRKSKADPAETIRGLRQHALTVSAADLGLGPTADRPQVWGVVMETGYPEAVATLVVLGEKPQACISATVEESSAPANTPQSARQGRSCWRRLSNTSMASP